MGAGQEIRDIEELRSFHTPTGNDGDTRNYHSHVKLTSHYTFASTVLAFARQHGLEIDDVAFKVDKVVESVIESPKGGLLARVGFSKSPSPSKTVQIAERFFLIARIRNPEFQLASDVETFLIARNSHDKRLPMEVAIGNKVVVCSNLMFGGDIAIKARNSTYGLDTLKSRLVELLQEYKLKVRGLSNDINGFKSTIIEESHGLAFIAHHASSCKFIQTSRTAAVCEMFIRPEHSPEYQYDDGTERYTIWRLMNAYTYVHRGELVIDPKTNEPYEDQRRTQVCPLELKKAYTADLWERLVKASDSLRGGLDPKTWYTNWDKEIDTLKV